MATARRPILCLVTDFGVADPYAGTMKLAALRACSSLHIVDITHDVPRHDILSGSLALERSVAAAGAGTVHVGVVDPGVGSNRRIVIVELRHQRIVCPDNGLATWAIHRHGPARTSELTWRPARFSSTFHGRDIMAPAAAMLANGARVRAMARPIGDAVMLNVAPVSAATGKGSILHIDHFGNLTTDIVLDSVQHSARAVADKRIVYVGRRRIGPLLRGYSDVARGKLVALEGSAGLLEIAVREGSAARVLGTRIGDRVSLR